MALKWRKQFQNGLKVLWKTRAYIYLHFSDDVYIAERISFHNLSFIQRRSGVLSLLYA